MAGIKGALEYKKFQEGRPLTRKQAMLAHCFQCNGEEEGAVDCQGYSCPLYQYFYYKGKKRSNDVLKPKKEAITEV